MFKKLVEINSRPEPFQFYTTDSLWTDQHTSKQMLNYHLNESVDLSSRNKNFINRSVQWIASRFNITPEFRICDFGCGPGLYTTKFAAQKAEVTGIDFSERSIKYAKETAAQNGLEINYVLQSYLEFDTDKKFDLIIMIMCDYCALSPEQRKIMLNKFYNFLLAAWFRKAIWRVAKRLKVSIFWGLIEKLVPTLCVGTRSPKTFSIY